MVDYLFGYTDVGLCSFAYRLRGVQVPIEAREVTAGDVESDSMPGLEDVAGLPKSEGHLVDLTRSQHGWFRERLPKPGPKRTLCNENGPTARVRV